MLYEEKAEPQALLHLKSYGMWHSFVRSSSLSKREDPLVRVNVTRSTINLAKILLVPPLTSLNHWGLQFLCVCFVLMYSFVRVERKVHISICMCWSSV